MNRRSALIRALTFAATVSVVIALTAAPTPTPTPTPVPPSSDSSTSSKSTPAPETAPVDVQLQARFLLGHLAHEVCANLPKNNHPIFVVTKPIKPQLLLLDTTTALMTRLNDAGAALIAKPSGGPGKPAAAAAPPTAGGGLIGDITGIGQAMSAISSILNTLSGIVKMFIPDVNKTAFGLVIPNEVVASYFNPNGHDVYYPELFGTSKKTSGFLQDLGRLQNIASKIADLNKSPTNSAMTNWQAEYTKFVTSLSETTASGGSLLTSILIAESIVKPIDPMPENYYYLYVTFDIAGGTQQDAKSAFSATSKLSLGVSLEAYLVDETGDCRMSGTYCYYQGLSDSNKLQGKTLDNVFQDPVH